MLNKTSDDETEEVAAELELSVAEEDDELDKLEELL